MDDRGTIFALTCIDEKRTTYLSYSFGMRKQEFIDLVEMIKEKQWEIITNLQDFADGEDLYEEILKILVTKYGFKMLEVTAEYGFNSFEFFHDLESGDSFNRS